MRCVRFVLWMVVGCGGRSSGPPPIVGNTHASDTPATTLAAELERTIGGGSGGASVAILPAADGLVAMSSTGAHRTVLVRGFAVSWVLVDPHRDVVWFSDDARTTIYALDLDAPAANGAKPHVVLTNVPDGYGEFDAAYPSEHPDPGIPAGADDTHVSLTMDQRERRVVLHVAARPLVEGQGGFFDTSATGSDTDVFAGTVAAAAKLADVAFVEALAKRPDRSAIVEQKEVAVEGVDPAPCSDGTSCGQGVMVTGTKFADIIVGMACGDGCFLTHRIYDLTTKTAIAADWATWLSRGAVLSPDRAAFVADGVVVRFDRGPLGDVPDAGARRRGGGWIRGGDGDRYL
jgi:hypothetical protein